MFVPRYWSEASHREALSGRRAVTVRRFGWSSESQVEADAHARARLEEALQELRRGGERALRELKRRERRTAYGGGEGLPIREEIVEEHEATDVVITRNAYGALCLNAPRALFVDVDRPPAPAGIWPWLGLLAGALGGAIAGPSWPGLPSAHALGAAAGAALGGGVATLAAKAARSARLRSRDLAAWVRRRIEAWCEPHGRWLVHVYETPAGIRLLVAHREFTASDEEARGFLRFVRADPLYVRLCALQDCFRARVSPKPWRVGMERRFPSGGVWPVSDPAKLAARRAWIEDYESKCAGRASCRYLESVGSAREDPRVEAVRRIHDERSGAQAGLEIA